MFVEIKIYKDGSIICLVYGSAVLGYLCGYGLEVYIGCFCGEEVGIMLIRKFTVEDFYASLYKK